MASSDSGIRGRIPNSDGIEGYVDPGLPKSDVTGCHAPRRYTPHVMDDERWEPGMPALDRQAVRTPVLPPSLQGLPPRSVPELSLIHI